MSNNSEVINLTQALFQLITRLPHLHLNVRPIDGLTKSEHELLVVLRFNTHAEKNMLSASEITNLLQITPGGGTHLFKPLERAGYLVRTQDARDRRITLVGLTEKGQAATDLLLADINQEIDGLIAYLGKEDSRIFIDLLSRVFDYITPDGLS